MFGLKALVKTKLPASFLAVLRRARGLFLARGSKYGKYRSIRLTDDDIRQGDYMRHMGGGALKWERRGEFQLHLMEEAGMVPASSLLDVGCGPGRGSKHLIDYLEADSYVGVDNNADFVRAARRMAEEKSLDTKGPRFEVVEDFEFGSLGALFDFALVFSVLNFCRDEERRAFFDNIQRVVRPGGTVVISHGSWFDESILPLNSKIALSRKLTSADFEISRFGWKEDARLFPILEFRRGD